MNQDNLLALQDRKIDQWNTESKPTIILFKKDTKLLLVCKLAPIHQGKEETKEETGYSRLISGRFNEQGKLLKGVFWVAARDLCT